MPEELRPLVSIVVINYNYARFIADAINSVLRQSYSSIELVVVDDGSTDNSREVMESFGDRITRVYKQNGGQASANNAGYARTRGDLVMFLDADDYLEPDVIEEVVRHWNGKATKIHFRLDIVDEHGNLLGQDPASDVALPHGDIKTHILSRAHYHTPPASGNVYSRAVLQLLMPIPEDQFRRAADSYLYTLSPLYGAVIALPRVGAKYRKHGSNVFLKQRRFSSTKDLVGILQRVDRCVHLVQNYTQEKGISSTYSPKYYAHANFTRMLLRRVERKLDYPTTFRLLGYILYAVSTDGTYPLKLRWQILSRSFFVAFAPMFFIWRVFPNTRPVIAADSTEKPAKALAVE